MSETTTIAPIRRSVVVPCEPARAFTLFTDGMSSWWPLATHSVGQADTVGLTVEPRVGGRVSEQLRSGESATWGTVTAWSPPSLVVMTWHPGYGAELATEVSVRFTDRGGSTLVELEHSGWERLADGPAKRADYDGGWLPVLGAFAAVAGGAPDDVR